MDIKQIREKFPQYADVSDGDLLLGFHRKFYSDMPIKDFMSRVDPEDKARFTISDKMWDYWESEVSKKQEGESSAELEQRLYGSIAPDVGKAEGITRSALQGATFGFGEELGAAGAAALGSAMGEGSFPDIYQQAVANERERMKQFSKENPLTSFGTELAGGLATGGLTGVGKTLGGVLTRGAIGGGLYGAGATDGGVVERAKGAAGGAAIAAPLSLAGHLVAPKISEGAKRLRKMGVPLTPGQYFGGFAQSVEQAAKQVPLVGEVPRKARERAMKEFTRVTMDEALAPIGKKLSADAKKYGREALREARDLVSQSYDDVASKIGSISFSPGILNRTSRALGARAAAGPGGAMRIVSYDAYPAIGPQGVKTLKRYFDKVRRDFGRNRVMPGSEYKALDSELRKAAMKFRASSAVEEQSIGDAIDKLRQELFDEVVRQAGPEVGDALRKTDFAYKMMDPISRAFDSTVSDEFFTPARLASSLRASSASQKQQTGFRTGQQPMQKLIEQAKDVFGEKEYSSARDFALITGLLGGLGATTGGAGILGAAAAVPAIYSKIGSNLLIPTVEGVGTGVSQALKRTAAPIGGLLGSYMAQQ
jgi:hypothetical protein